MASLAVVAVGVHTALLCRYTGAEWGSALGDGVISVGLLCGLAYLAWYIVGFVSLLQTDLMVGVLALAFWLAGGFVGQYAIGQSYKPFAETLPFRLLFGVLTWAVIMLWYRLQALQTLNEGIREEAASKEEELRELLRQPVGDEGKPQPEAPGCIDRITVKDDTSLHDCQRDPNIVRSLAKRTISFC